MQVIKDKDELLAIIYRSADWIKGLSFITPESLFIQVGSWYYQKGTRLASHIHKVYERMTNRTHEVVYVKQGSMKLLLYGKDKDFKEEIILFSGDLAVLVDGGHGYEILEDNTQVLEVKNGPFIDVDKDKEKF